MQSFRSARAHAALPAVPGASVGDAFGSGSGAPVRSRSAWATGFMTNALNPKATLFFVAAFAVLVSPRTPRLVQAGYGVWIALTTMAWFSFVAFVFAHERVRASFLRRRHWLDRSLGVVFLVFAAGLVAASVR